MRITADTNVLVRLIMADDETQNALATAAVENASLVAVSIHALCELVWVLDRHYGVARTDIATAIRALIDTSNVVVNRPGAEAGLAMLDAGGDFADGVVAYEGQWLGGERFVSFDRKAVNRLLARGQSAQLLQ
ncbi:type II toxin-antitoxin system VapC family toxin [Nitrospirillum sp. BR 11828]|uniref:type II toxin-antitoxin system VapC family toxin n=1 Tax=Nitrospirillum sp. BR 11828 TaxID=3104325 RepID=UPI002ACAD66B|nr:type II toxin-antitoxin system VapC family toxin [Nitrospirillum sp. BR 11828]MDZ5646504.1 type II toxin-antitoxin system VapC family toxin [Nitrospirillum sp. BR 11828]